MTEESPQKELNRITKEPFSITNIFTKWYAARYGKTAGIPNLYQWAAEKDLLITRFNEIPKSDCLLFIITPRGADYMAFEVEAIDNGERKGFHLALIISLFYIYPIEGEVGLEKLKFEKAFRLEEGVVVETAE